ncbi:MAG TPA: HAD family hydrolase [Clostridia bacterium]|nr:HAD family hydrolase [Clostridia bacterium]
MKKYDTIIFDLDGTLLNTLEDLTDSVNYALALYGFPNRRMEEVRSFVGNGVANLMGLSIAGGSDNPYYEKCLADFRRHYSGNLQNKTGPYGGIMELLEKLSEAGYKLAIVSNKFDKAVKGLSEFYFGEYIKVAIGESEDVSRKPAPDTVLKALEELGSNADKAVYVGDSEVDARTAGNSGTMFVGVTWGFRDREVLELEGADYIIDKPEELLRIIEGK